MEYKTPSAINEGALPQFRIYPNPVTRILTVECLAKEVNTTTLEILDISGKVVYSEIQETGNQSIDISHLAGGIYYLKLSNAKYSLIEKIIKLD